MLDKYLTSINPNIDSEILQTYIDSWTEQQHPRKTILTEPGNTQKDLYFIFEGIQKSYFLNDGKEHIIAFTYAPSFSGIPESFFTQTPSKYYLETITNTKLLKISYDKHMELLQEHRPIETLFRLAAEKILFGLVHRHYELMALDIETRFKNFLQRSPHLLNQIPHKDLASYLRIDASNFSKLLGKVKILV
ncbi:MAG: Crp/Fnr family transcriptional regulator [Lentisphaeria bacterium]|nr:Crp/Fnr family transcriptional regulator [Lentisphaeria bacterium]